MTLALEQSARQLFQHELDQRRNNRAGYAQFGLTLQASPVSWLLPKLLRLVMNNTDRPLEDLRPMVRSMLCEQFFASTGGDTVDYDQLQKSIDETVVILMHTLKAVREQAEQDAPDLPPR